MFMLCVMYWCHVVLCVGLYHVLTCVGCVCVFRTWYAFGVLYQYVSAAMLNVCSFVCVVVVGVCLVCVRDWGAVEINGR